MRYPACVLAAAASLLAACQAPPSADSSVHAIADAADSGALIQFRSELPLDEPSNSGTLPLALAARRGLESDPSLQAALARVRIAEADARQARLLPNPVMNFILRWGPGKPQFEISLAQDVLEALTMPQRIDAADNRFRQAASDAVTCALDSLEQIQIQYADTQAADQLARQLAARVELLDRLARAAQTRLDAGEGTSAEVVSFRAKRSEAALELRQAQLDTDRQRLRLARLVGEPSSSATWTLGPFPPSVGVRADEQAWVASALRHRPELQALQWKLASLGDELFLARTSVWRGASIGVDSQRDDSWFTGPSISLPIPVFDTGRVRAERAHAEIVEARHEWTLAARISVEQTRVAFRSYSAANEMLADLESTLLPQSDSRLQLVRDSLTAGQADTTAVLLAEQDLCLAQIKEIEVRRQIAGSLARLQRAAGGPGNAAPLVDDKQHAALTAKEESNK